MRKSFFSNIGYTFLAQIIQLTLSVTVSFLLPKMLGIEQFGYWQLFIFYNSFAGFFHFGLVDGIYLKEGGNTYSKLKYPCIGFQLRCIVCFNCFLILFGIAYSILFLEGPRMFVIIASCTYILIANINAFFSLILQSVNEIKKSSLGRLFYSVSFLVFILFEFFLGDNRHFQIFIFVYFIANILSLLYFIFNAKDIVRVFFTDYLPEYKKEMIVNLKNGFVLMLANITGLMILGIGRFMIDNTWGIEIFSIVSFALTLVNFVLMFTNQVSVVLYPELRYLGYNETERLYKKLSLWITTLSPFFLVTFFPLTIIIKIWLPDYMPSVEYMSILLPICIFESRNQLQINTYFKVYNRPRDLLFSNIIAVIASGVIILFAITAFNSVKLAVISMLMAVVIKYVVSLYILRRDSFIKEVLSMLPEVVIICLFIMINIYYSLEKAACLYSLLITLYVYYKRKEVLSIMSCLLKKYK